MKASNYYVVAGRRMAEDKDRGGWKLEDETWVLWLSPRKARNPAYDWVGRVCFRSAQHGWVWMDEERREIFGQVRVASMAELGPVRIRGREGAERH